jgi:hypothetical protein
VRAGIFERRITLHGGRNRITARARSGGQTAVERLAVRRGRAAAALGAELRRNRPGVVPNVVGERLDTAEAVIRHAGLRSRRVKIGAGRVIPKGWAVCVTRPRAGTRIGFRRPIVLLIDHADPLRTSGTACAQL